MSLQDYRNGLIGNIHGSLLDECTRLMAEIDRRDMIISQKDNELSDLRSIIAQFEKSSASEENPS